MGLSESCTASMDMMRYELGWGALREGGKSRDLSQIGASLL